MTEAPETTRPQSARRRTRPATSDRQRQVRIVVIALVAGAIGALVVAPHSLLRHHASAPPAPTSPTVVPGRTLLFAHLDAQRRVDLLMLVARQPGGRSANIVFVPPHTVVEVPSLDLVAFADVTHDGDRQLLVTAVENALGVRIDDLLVVDDTALARLLAPAGSLDVTFTAPVQPDDADGSGSLSSGRHHLTSAQLRRVLLAHETDGTLSHLVTVQAVMTSWLHALQSPATRRATLRVDGHAAVLVDAASAGTTTFDTLPVDPVNAGSSERFQIRDQDTATLVATDFPFARLTLAGRRPRVELLNGVGSVGITPRAARLLVPAGANVQLTSNVPGFGVRTSTVVYYRDADAPAARRFAAVLGVGAVAKGDTPLDLVDITVVIGRDFVVHHPS
jgi:hypothetical protein